MPNSVLSTLAILRISKSCNAMSKDLILWNFWAKQIYGYWTKNEATLAEVLFYAKKKEVQF